MSDRLRVLAVSAPHWPCRSATRSIILESRVPFSLQNACRLAAGTALSGQGSWGASNWRDKESLRSSVMMYDYATDLDAFETKLREVRPNLLLIGAMSLALPGAVQIAEMAKRILGESVTVVLGGKHVSETMYKDGEHVRHHLASPLRLMSEGKIPAVFDIVVSGDGEHVILRLGEIVACKGTVTLSDLRSLLASCPGNWIAGKLEGTDIHTVTSFVGLVNYSTMPIPAEIFGFHGAFKVFGTDRTAHLYSDISRGCMYDCFFCTERSRVNGPPQLKGAARRLARQLKAAAREGEKEGDKVSAFVEDSILLMGKIDELEELSRLLSDECVIPFGGQITVDIFLRERVRKALGDLTRHGLCYLFAGMETASEAVAQSMSKNVGRSGALWVQRTEEAIRYATDMGIKYGVSVLFGLGESQADRVRQLRSILAWQQAYSGNPCVVSLNWATQHPLLDVSSFDYTHWGTPADSELLPYFQEMFGEVSALYPVVQDMPTVSDLEEIRSLVGEMSLEQ